MLCKELKIVEDSPITQIVRWYAWENRGRVNPDEGKLLGGRCQGKGERSKEGMSNPLTLCEIPKDFLTQVHISIFESNSIYQG